MELPVQLIVTLLIVHLAWAILWNNLLPPGSRFLAFTPLTTTIFHTLSSFDDDNLLSGRPCNPISCVLHRATPAGSAILPVPYFELTASQ